MWLGWLLVVPLLAALGWLVYTIVQETGGPGGGVTQGSTAAVTAAEAEELAEDFYRRLEEGGLESAREVMTEEAWLHPEIADGLQGIELSGLSVQEEDDGTAVVTAEATYTYGVSTIVQDETLRVGRVDGELLIVSRSGIPRVGDG